MGGTTIGDLYKAGGLAAVWPRVKRPLRDALVLVGIGRAIYYFWIQGVRPWEFLGVDARAYWGIDLASPYVQSGVGVHSTYLYSPAFAQLLAPFSNIPFEWFFALWTLMNVALLVWLVKPWPWVVPMLILPIVYELCVGNIHFLLAACSVAGVSAAAVWAFPVLTKITPGIGSLWLLFRGEVRLFAIAVGTTLAIVAVSYLANPEAWQAWFAFLTSSAGVAEWLPLRLAGAAALLLVGARKGWAWTVAVAVWIAIPVVWVNAWVVLLGTIRLSRMRIEPLSGPIRPAILRWP